MLEELQVDVTAENKHSAVDFGQTEGLEVWEPTPIRLIVVMSDGCVSVLRPGGR